MSKGHLYAPLSWVKKKLSEIWDAITEQNSKLPLNIVEQLTDRIEADKTTVTLKDGKKFSDYKYIVISSGVDAYAYSMVTLEVFKTLRIAMANYENDGLNGWSYVSDTQATHFYGAYKGGSVLYGVR